MHWVTVTVVMWWLSQLDASQSVSTNDDDDCEDNVPEDCNFGSNFCGWLVHNWTRYTQWKYAVLENRKSSGYIESKVRCVSSPISHCLKFRFYLEKSHENTLNVSIMWPRNKTEVLLWTYSTNTRWINAAVPVVTESSFALIIRGRRQNVITNRQIGVDGINYERHGCTLIPSPDGVKCENTVPKDCYFGSDFCGWKEKNWTRHTNAKYAFLDDGKSSGHITSKVRCVKLPITHCFTFKFYLQSNEESTLRVSIAWPHNKSESLLWTYSTKASWKDAAVPVESESNFALIIRARRQHSRDNSGIRLDAIVYTTQRCSLKPPSAEPPQITTEHPTTSRTPRITAKSKEKASTSLNRERNMNTTCIYLTQTTNTIDITSLSSGTLGDPASSAKVGMIVGVVTAIVAVIVIVVIGLVILRRMRLRASHRKPEGDTNQGEKSENNTQANSTETRTTAGQDVILTHANNRGELYVNQCHNTQKSSTSPAHRYRDSEGYEIPCTRQGNTKHTTISSLRIGKTQHIKSINPRQGTAGNPSNSEQHGVEMSSGAQNNNTYSRVQTRDKTNVPPTGFRDIGSCAHSSDVYEISPDRENNEQTRDNTNVRQLQEREARTAKRTSTRTYDILDFTDADKERRVYADLGTTSPAPETGDGASMYEALQVNTDIHVYRQLPGFDKN